MKQTIITPVSKDGIINPASVLVEQSELEVFAKKLWQFILYCFALIGFGAVLSWLI